MIVVCEWASWSGKSRLACKVRHCTVRLETISNTLKSLGAENNSNGVHDVGVLRNCDWEMSA